MNSILRIREDKELTSVCIEQTDLNFGRVIMCKSNLNGGLDTMLKVERKKALELNAIHGYRGIAYDGYWFYLTIENENIIVKCDDSFNQIECYETCKCYTYICYDSIEDCFWATDREDSSCIYKLNNLFVEIDKLDISVPEVRGKNVNGISHNYESDMLFISFSNAIVSLDKYSLNDCRILYGTCNKRIQGVTDIFSSDICFGITRPRQEIRISSLNGRLTKRIFVPSCFRIESMVSVPNGRNYGKSHLYVLLTNRNGEQFVMEFIVEDCSICERERCCNEALDSIATEEAMIAHCLKVESEKLINIIHSTNNEREINTAMTLLIKLIDRAANQERELIDRLLKLKEHCDFCNEMCSNEDED